MPQHRALPRVQKAPQPPQRIPLTVLEPDTTDNDEEPEENPPPKKKKPAQNKETQPKGES
jgi:hypothetical protein